MITRNYKVDEEIKEYVVFEGDELEPVEHLVESVEVKIERNSPSIRDCQHLIQIPSKCDEVRAYIKAHVETTTGERFVGSPQGVLTYYPGGLVVNAPDAVKLFPEEKQRIMGGGRQYVEDGGIMVRTRLGRWDAYDQRDIITSVSDDNQTWIISPVRAFEGVNISVAG